LTLGLIGCIDATGTVTARDGTFERDSPQWLDALVPIGTDGPLPFGGCVPGSCPMGLECHPIARICAPAAGRACALGRSCGADQVCVPPGPEAEAPCVSIADDDIERVAPDEPGVLAARVVHTAPGAVNWEVTVDFIVAFEGRAVPRLRVSSPAGTEWAAPPLVGREGRVELRLPVHAFGGQPADGRWRLLAERGRADLVALTFGLRFDCPQRGCCPVDAPHACGDRCCLAGWSCGSAADDACVPPGGRWCAGALACAAGEMCAVSGSGCLPEGASECEDGLYCTDGQRCADLPRAPQIRCCPADSSDCSDRCCAAGTQCRPDDEGATCVPDGEIYCGPGWTCGGDEACGFETHAASGGAIRMCMPTAAEDCGNGEFCRRGRHCAPLPAIEADGIGCCPDGTVGCGDRCCPGAGACVLHADGGTCVGVDRVYCGPDWTCPRGESCGFDSFAATGGRLCLPSGAQDCGNGEFCRRGSRCAELPDSQLDGIGCCPDGTVGCGDRCCPVEDRCRLHADGGTCVAPGREYCGPGWTCAPGDTCGFASYEATGRPFCIPDGADDCGIRASCAAGLRCALLPDLEDDEDGIVCCGHDTIDCYDRCCADDALCMRDDGGGTCVAPGRRYCGPEWTCRQHLDCGWASNAATGRPSCVPAGADDCGNHTYCAPGLRCAFLPDRPGDGDIGCCTPGSLDCFDRCCPAGSGCRRVNGGGQCVAG